MSAAVARRGLLALCLSLAAGPPPAAAAPAGVSAAPAAPGPTARTRRLASASPEAPPPAGSAVAPSPAGSAVAAPPAGPGGVPGFATAPVLALDPRTPPEASALGVSAVHHDVVFTPEAAAVVTTWTLAAGGLAGSAGGLLVSGPQAGAVRLIKAEVDGAAAAIGLYTARPWRAWIALPEPASAAARRTTVRLYYTLALPRHQTLYRLGRDAFPRLDRLVADGGRRGWDLRPLSPFSYADPLPTTASVRHPPGYAVVASGRTRPTASGTEIEPVDAAQYLVLLYDRKAWSVSDFVADGTTFRHLRPARQPQFAPDAVRRVVEAAWPRLRKRLGPATLHVAIVETDDGALSGGLLGTNVTALFARGEVGFAEAAFIQQILGWPSAASSRAYVARAYRGAPDPWRDYLTGMLCHELAHFWFGFGRSYERVLQTYDEWLSLGLGLVYDSEVTRQLTGRDAALFEASELVWRTRYAEDPAVDQRLDHPDVAHDPRGLARVQTYAHSKARVVLRALRAGVGPAAFDRAVRDYLAAPAGDGPLGYPRLRRELLKAAPTLPELERQAGLAAGGEPRGRAP